jgi:hypothetical protein
MTGFINHTKFSKTDNRDRQEIKEIRSDNRVQDRQQIPNRLQRSEEMTEVRTENTNSTNCFRCLMLEHS